MSAPFSISFNVPWQDAIDQAQSRGVVLPEAYYALPDALKGQAQTISGMTRLDQIQRVHDAMTARLKDGGTFAQFKKEADSFNYGLNKNQLDLVFRNAVQNAYQAGHWRNFEANKASRGYLMYSSINDGRTRPAHRALSGTIRPVDDAFWATHSPPCGHRCRCTLISLTEAQAKARSPNGEGLNKPIDGLSADKGWGYKPTQQSARLSQMEAEKLSKANAGIAKAYNDGMKRLPNYKNAVINDAKLVNYALNIDHPVGGNKARRIRAALGFNASHKDIIIAAIRRAIIENPAIEGASIEWGRVFTVDFLLTGEIGEAIVRTSWIIDVESDVPRMTSFYIKES